MIGISLLQAADHFHILSCVDSMSMYTTRLYILLLIYVAFLLSLFIHMLRCIAARAGHDHEGKSRVEGAVAAWGARPKPDIFHSLRLGCLLPLSPCASLFQAAHNEYHLVDGSSMRAFMSLWRAVRSDLRLSQLSWSVLKPRE